MVWSIGLVPRVRGAIDDAILLGRGEDGVEVVVFR